MKKKVITLLILPITFGLLWLKNTNSFIQFSTLKAETLKVLINDYSALINSKDWIDLKKYWKSFNQLESEDNKNIKNTLFSKAQKKFNDVYKYIKNLYDRKLITLKQKEILVRLFEERYSHYYRLYGMVTCYKASMDSMNLTKTQYEIEEQFLILEKLYSENKINDTVFKTTKNKIQEDLKIINSYQKDKYLNSSEAIYFIDLLSK